jgi:putative phage-type endonuclease
VKAIRIASTLDLSRDEWLEARTRGYGGSDLAAILGLNPWHGPGEVWAEKTRRLATKPDTDAMEWGRRLEDAVCRKWADDNGRRIQHVYAILQARTNPRALANIDRLAIAPEEVVEGKTASEHMADWWSGDEPPDWAHVQALDYTGVLEVERAHVAVLIGGRRYRSWTVYRDDDLIREMWARADEWWDRYVVRDQPPPFDGTQASTDLIARLYPTAEPTRSVDLGEAGEALRLRYLTAKRDADEAAERLEAVKNEVKGLMGDAPIATVGGEVVFTWKETSRTSIDTKALAAAYPDIAAEFTRRSSYRRFLGPS